FSPGRIRLLQKWPKANKQPSPGAASRAAWSHSHPRAGWCGLTQLCWPQQSTP
ncbi:hypothetical protein HGM15179_015591, partial [Zosterops borbonicus]